MKDKVLWDRRAYKAEHLRKNGDRFFAAFCDGDYIINVNSDGSVSYLARKDRALLNEPLPEGMAWDSQEAKDWAEMVWRMS